MVVGTQSPTPCKGVGKTVLRSDFIHKARWQVGAGLWTSVLASHTRMNGRKPQEKTGRQRKLLLPWTRYQSTVMFSLSMLTKSEEAQFIQCKMLVLSRLVFLICLAEKYVLFI